MIQGTMKDDFPAEYLEALRGALLDAGHYPIDVLGQCTGLMDIGKRCDGQLRGKGLEQRGERSHDLKPQIDREIDLNR